MAGVKGRSGPKQEKPWREALMLAVNEADGDAKKLRLLAQKCVERGLEGDMSAIKEIGDRLDGKAPQSVDVTHHEPSIDELSDAELADIARRGGQGAAEEEGGKGKLSTLH